MAAKIEAYGSLPPNSDRLRQGKEVLVLTAFFANRAAAGFGAGVKVAPAFFEPASRQQALDGRQDWLLSGRGVASHQFKERVQVDRLLLQRVEELEKPSLSFVHNSFYW